jgi:signal transduction histidine kinase
MIQDHPVEAEETLEKVIDEARGAIEEGRDAVQNLRSSTVVTNDLLRAIDVLGEQLSELHTGPGCPEFRVQVEGKTRELAPLVRDEIHRIAYEAVRNAFSHSRARCINVEIHYSDRQFRLRVSDDGKGMDPKTLDEGGRSGHHGLPGMRERAELAGGKLTIWSKPGSGTEIELSIPASFAYLG